MPQFTPVQGSVTLPFPPYNTGVTAVLYTVPAGQRLVIHYVGGFGPQSGQVSTFEVQTTVNGQTVTFVVIPTLAAQQSVTYTIVAKGVTPGDAHTKFILSSANVTTPITAEESTTVY